MGKTLGTRIKIISSWNIDAQLLRITTGKRVEEYASATHPDIVISVNQEFWKKNEDIFPPIFFFEAKLRAKLTIGQWVMFPKLLEMFGKARTWTIFIGKNDQQKQQVVDKFRVCLTWSQVIQTLMEISQKLPANPDRAVVGELIHLLENLLGHCGIQTKSETDFLNSLKNMVEKKIGNGLEVLSIKGRQSKLVLKGKKQGFAMMTFGRDKMWRISIKALSIEDLKPFTNLEGDRSLDH